MGGPKKALSQKTKGLTKLATPPQLSKLLPAFRSSLRSGTELATVVVLSEPKKTLSRKAEGEYKTGDDLLSHRSSTIGAIELDFRVRDGNGYNLNAMTTR